MMNPLQLWEAEVRRGVDGQDISRPDTWRLDALWRAACWWRAGQDADAAFGRGTGDPERARAMECLAEEVEHAHAA